MLPGVWCSGVGAPESAAASAGDMSRLQSQGSGIAVTGRSGSFAQVGDTSVLILMMRSGTLSSLAPKSSAAGGWAAERGKGCEIFGCLEALVTCTSIDR